MVSKCFWFQRKLSPRSIVGHQYIVVFRYLHMFLQNMDLRNIQESPSHHFSGISKEILVVLIIFQVFPKSILTVKFMLFWLPAACGGPRSQNWSPLPPIFYPKLIFFAITALALLSFGISSHQHQAQSCNSIAQQQHCLEIVLLSISVT